MSQYQLIDKRVPIALNNPSITHDLDKCKNCTLCRRACADVMSVLDYYDLDAMVMFLYVFTVVNVRLHVHLTPCMLNPSLKR